MDIQTSISHPEQANARYHGQLKSTGFHCDSNNLVFPTNTSPRSPDPHYGVIEFDAQGIGSVTLDKAPAPQPMRQPEELFLELDAL
jgi:hypothetical protein